MKLLFSGYPFGYLGFGRSWAMLQLAQDASMNFGSGMFDRDGTLPDSNCLADRCDGEVGLQF